MKSVIKEELIVRKHKRKRTKHERKRVDIL